MSEQRTGLPRRIAFGAVAGLAAVLSLVLTVDATGGAVAGEDPGHRLTMIAHAPWLGLGWCLAFAVLVRGGRNRTGAMQQLLGMLVALYVGGGLIAHEPDPVFYVGFGLFVGLLVLLHPDRRAVFRPGPAGLSPALLVLALVALGPLLVYAADVMTLADRSDPDAPFYTAIAATATAVPFVAAAASLRARWFRLPGWSATLMLASLGVGSLLCDDPGALSPLAATLAVAGAAAMAVLVERDARAPMTGVQPVEA